MKLKNIILIGLIVPNILWADRFTKNGEIVMIVKQNSIGKPTSSKKFDWSGAIEHCSN